MGARTVIGVISKAKQQLLSDDEVYDLLEQLEVVKVKIQRANNNGEPADFKNLKDNQNRIIEVLEKLQPDMSDTAKKLYG